jgi:hypothetical protein
MSLLRLQPSSAEVHIREFFHEEAARDFQSDVTGKTSEISFAWRKAGAAARRHEIRSNISPG